jgi:hypothetical protein
MAKKENYKYVITLDTPMWPRKLADDLSFAPSVNRHLLSVTDLQNDGHIYGATYVLDAGSEEMGGDTDVRYPL